MTQQVTYPHSGYYQSTKTNSITYKSNFSSNMDVQRLINGQPAFIHYDGQHGLIPKTLVLNDWRCYIPYEKSFIVVSIYDALHDLVCREPYPFSIYLPSHEGFTEFTKETTLTDLVELCDTEMNTNPQWLGRSSVEIAQSLATHINKAQGINECSEENIFVIDQFEMDALINKTHEVVYSTSLQDIIEILNLDDYANLKREEIFPTICLRTDFFTSNTIICFDDNIANIYSFHENFKNCFIKEITLINRRFDKFNEMIKSYPEIKEKGIKLDKQLYCLYLAPNEEIQNSLIKTILDNSHEVIDLHLTEYPIYFENTSSFFEAHSNIERIKISSRQQHNYSEDDAPVLSQLTSNSWLDKLKTGKIKTLTLDFLQELDYSYLNFYLSQASQIEHILISISEESSCLDENFLLTKLKHLTISGSICDADVLKLIMFSPNIESLVVGEITEHLPFEDTFESFNLAFLKKISIFEGINPTSCLLNIVLPSLIENIDYLNLKSANNDHTDGGSLVYETNDGINTLLPILYNKFKKLGLSKFKISSEEISSIINNACQTLYFLDLDCQYFKENSLNYDQNEIRTNLIYFSFFAGDCNEVACQVISSSPFLKSINLCEYDIDIDINQKQKLLNSLRKCLYLNIFIGCGNETNFDKDRFYQAIEDGSIIPMLIEYNTVESNKRIEGKSTESVKVDAEYNPEESINFDCEQIFQHKSGNHPHVSDYRMDVYDVLEINPNYCSQEDAFTLRHGSADLSLIDIPTLNQGDIDINELPDDDRNQYYLGKKCFEATDNWQPIPSLSADETLLNFNTMPAKNVSIKYSIRDNLYYMKTDPSLAEGAIIYCTFIIQVPIKMHFTKNDTFIRKCSAYTFSCLVSKIQSYKNSQLIYNKKIKHTGNDYLDLIIEQRKGSCRHRAVALKAMIDKDKQFWPNLSIRIVNNDCHSYCELIIPSDSGRNHYYKIDLGGAPATLNISQALAPIDMPMTDEPSTTKGIELTPFQKIKEKKSIQETLQNIAIPNEKKTKIGKLFSALQGVSNQTFDEIKSKLFETKNQNPALLKTNSLKNSYHILLQCISYLDNTHTYHIIYHPDELLTTNQHIAPHPNGSNEGVIVNGSGGALYDFIHSAKNDSKKVFLFVMYDTFTTKDIVTFNRLIDEENRFADCMPLPDEVTVIGIYNTKSSSAYTGSDFTSRFSNIYSLVMPDEAHQNQMNETNDDESCTIELFNDPLWHERLIGHWQMQGEKLTFIESNFIEILKKGKYKSFIFSNPIESEAFYHCLEKAKVLGYFTVNHKHIPTPSDFSYSIKHGFDYAPYKSYVKLHVTEHLNPTHMFVLNETLLEDFIGGYKVYLNSKQAQVDQGLIRKCSENQSYLHIFINEPMRNSSWAKLLSMIQFYKVQTYFYALSKLLYPEQMASDIGFYNIEDSNHLHPEKRQRVEKEEDDLEQDILIIKDEDIDFAQYEFIQRTGLDESELLIIDVSEVRHEQLLYEVDAKYDQSTNVFMFYKHDGILLNPKYNQKNIILKGYFKSELVNKLAKYLCQKLNILNRIPSRQLILIPKNIDCFDFLPKSNHVTFSFSPAFKVKRKQACLADKLSLTIEDINNIEDKENILTMPISVLQASHFMPNKTLPWNGFSNVSHQDYSFHKINFDEASRISEIFYRDRFEEVKNRLQVDEDIPLHQSSYVFLTGLTGVGKTHFIKNIWSMEYPNCHYGLSDLLNFCTDQKTGIKTLFIDEANLSNSDFSMFEGLFEQNPHILIGQEIFPLTQQHKVIFAGNPLSYSVDRQACSFIERHGNCCLFNEIPPEVLLHEILTPLFQHYDLNSEDSTILAELFLTRQFFINHLANQIIVSPRELIAMVLLTMQKLNGSTNLDLLTIADLISHQVIKNATPIKIYDEFCQAFTIPTMAPMEQLECFMDDEFLMTPSRQACQQALKELLSLRQQRQSYQGRSTNESFMHDGLNGLLIEGEPGIGKSCLVKSVLQAMQTEYVAIPASQSLIQKEACLLDAFENGAVVIMDEINTAYLNEQFLNAILSGINPITHERAKKPGFLLIGTQNPASMSGRKVFGEALKRRFLHFPLPNYTSDEMLTILENKGMDSDTATYLIKYYQSQRLEKNISEGSLCFRDLLKITTELLKENSPRFSSNRGHLFFPAQVCHDAQTDFAYSTNHRLGA